MRSVVLLLFLGGCAVHVETSADAARLIGLGVVAAAIYGYEAERQPAPALAPDRKVSEQDCTRPIDHTQGNLRCK